MTIDFKKNGIHYHAEKGHAYAEKNGKVIWSAIDVFTKKEPTKYAVLALDKTLNEIDF